MKSEILAKRQFFDGLRSFSYKEISLHVIIIEMYRSECDLGTLHTHVYFESDVFCPLENRVKPFDM
jgi:hypothetical protein